MNEWVSFALAIATGVFSVGVSYGILQTKISDIETKMNSAVEESKADRRDIRDEQKSFVTLSHFEAVISPMRHALEVIEADIKEILRAVKN